MSKLPFALLPFCPLRGADICSSCTPLSRIKESIGKLLSGHLHSGWWSWAEPPSIAPLDNFIPAW